MTPVKTTCGVCARLLLACGVAPAQDSPGLTLGPDGDVLLRGQEVRAVGVNYFNTFYRNIIDKDNLTRPGYLGVSEYPDRRLYREVQQSGDAGRHARIGATIHACEAA